ncbi:MAG: arginine--tRNA ligase [Candidatus Roizmanbacteria bacterium]
MIKSLVAKSIKKVVPGNMPTLLKPKHHDFGDYSFHIKSLGKDVTQKEIEGLLQELKKDPLYQSVTLDGEFVNLAISHKTLFDEVREILASQTEYGSSKYGLKQTWLIEHTSPNPNKALHLGHLRNNILGMAISTIWEKAGITVIRDCVDNNRGIAIAKLMWGYLKFARKDISSPLSINYWQDNKDKWHSAEDLGMNDGEFIEMLYTKGSTDTEELEESAATVRQMVVDWEAKDKATWDLWTLVLSFSYAAQRKTLERLGNKWDKVWHEHEHYQEGKDFVEKGLEKNVFKKTPERTIITDLESYKLPDTVVIKSDGTSLYITQDIALTNLKLSTYHPDKLFWVIGSEQSLALAQMFAVCEQLGIGTRDQFTHIAYGLISIKGAGKMSSRKGNVIYIDDLIDEAKKKIIDSRTSITGKKLPEEVAESLALGAIKYSILKVSKNSSIDFDIDESINFEGNSGPYLQYTHARMCSVLTKSTMKEHALPSTLPIIEDSEQLLCRHLMIFPEIILEATQSYNPHTICMYAYELTQLYNAFYQQCPILTAPEDNKLFRLALTQASATILRESLRLLGIDAPERL